MCAFYGIDLNYRCSNGFYTGAPDVCYGDDSLDIVVGHCQGKAECTFDGNPTFENGYPAFRNWCPGYSNFLMIQWECVGGTSLATSTSETVVANGLPFCDILPEGKHLSI